jgi:hypothetical protein
MQRFAAIILLLCYAALGSGAAEYWHNAEHAAEDAALIQAAQDSGSPLDHVPLHDESNCPIHAQLHICCMVVGWTPLLICLGLLVAFLTLLTSRLPIQRAALAICCRGPPIQ